MKFANNNELVEKTYSGVTVKEPKAYTRNKTEMNVAGKIQLYPYINLGSDAKKNADWKAVGAEA